MRSMLVTVVVLLTLAMLGWIRADHGFDFRGALPFLSGEATMFDAAGLVIIVIAFCGLARLHRGSVTDQEPRHEYGDSDEPDEDN